MHKRIDSISIGGLTISTNKYIVKSRTRITTRTRFLGPNDYKYANVKVAIHQIKDSNCIIQDTIYAHIERYWNKQEKWMKKLPSYDDSLDFRGDFRHLPVNESFYKCGTDTVPFISPDYKGYTIFYFKENFYKIVLLKSKGLGGMGFIGQNMVFVHKGKKYTIDDFVTRWMDENRKILKMKKNCG